jgi:hypothetical protein
MDQMCPPSRDGMNSGQQGPLFFHRENIMFWVLEAVVAIGFLVSVAVSIDAAATRRESRSF